MKMICLIPLILIANCLAAQSFLVEYESKDEAVFNKVDLIFDDRFALFGTNAGRGSDKDDIFVKSYADGVSYFTKRFMTVSFNVKDSLHNFNWQLLPDTATILNQLCLSAKTAFRGRTYIAYYSPKYTVSEGPWKFGGLPGLILQVKSTDNYIEYRAIKIVENYAGKIQSPDLSKRKFLGWNEFVLEHKETVARYIKTVRASGHIPDGSTVGIKLDGEAEIYYPELQTGTGIKFQ